MRSLRQLEPSVHWTHEVTLDALGQTLARPHIEAVLERLHRVTQRTRKLPLVLTVLLCVAMNLFTDEALVDVLQKLLQGPRFLRDDEDLQPATDGAIAQRRQQLGVAPLQHLFRETCRPLATPQTPDAFLFGLRLMAIDGTLEEVPDSPANGRYFGRHKGGRGESHFPQVRAVYLCECGTHAICDAGFWPYRVSERVGGLRLLRSVGAGLLLLWDQGFHSYAMAQRTHQRGAHFLARMPVWHRLIPQHRLADGSYLAELPAPRRSGRTQAGPLRVRVIEYTHDDPARPGSGERHRLITSLLEPTVYPALTLVAAYHERWEVELTIDEADSHQRHPNQPLRSRTPLGVLQELYGLLLAHYAIRAVMQDAAVQAGVAPDRLSFVHALRLLRITVFEFQIVAEAQQAAWYQRLLQDIGRAQLPVRDHRCNPRVVKQKMSKFNQKREHHRHWPQPTKPFAEAIVILTKEY